MPDPEHHLILQPAGEAQGMRNELSFSSEVALGGPSWHVCCVDEEAYPRVLQASDQVLKGGCKQTGNLHPRDPRKTGDST